jgi:murein L,D-transpeptidase YafK
MPAQQPSSSQTPSLNLSDPRIVIKKGARTLELFDGERLVKTYPMVLGFAPVGDKEVVGDGKTPEGEFYIFVKNDKSKFYLSLGLSYPDADDAKRGLEKRLITRGQYDQKARGSTGLPDIFEAASCTNQRPAKSVTPR